MGRYASHFGGSLIWNHSPARRVAVPGRHANTLAASFRPHRLVRPAPASAPRGPEPADRRRPRAPHGRRGPERSAPAARSPGPSLEPATFARARAEQRFVVIDGAAEWCHWCHVMEATTYHDPEVRKLLDAQLHRREGRRRLAPRLRGALRRLGLAGDGAHDGGRRGGRQVPGVPAAGEVRRDPERGGRERRRTGPEAPRTRPVAPARPLSEAEIDGGARVDRAAARRALGPERGQLGEPAEGAARLGQRVGARRARGRATRRRAQRVLFTLDRQRGIVDPVWGGICQYSTDGDWQHPHYEKLMTYQAGAIDNYAAAYALTRRRRVAARRRRQVRGFVDRFMTERRRAASTRRWTRTSTRTSRASRT